MHAHVVFLVGVDDRDERTGGGRADEPDAFAASPARTREA